MLRICCPRRTPVAFVLSLLWLLPATGMADAEDAPQQLDPSSTYVLIVGVLQWQDVSLTTFSEEDRQDVALSQAFAELGVPASHIRVLLDQQATRLAVADAVDEICAKTEDHSTLIIYYAGHGMRVGSKGVFATYDLELADVLQTGWNLPGLSTKLQNRFRGRRVLLLADCCYSGELADVAQGLAAQGVDSASFTSAASFNTSTGNWTYTCGLIELLRGASLADRNDDGFISIEEAAFELRQGILHFEQQRNGFSLHGVSPEFRIAPVQSSRLPLTPERNAKIPLHEWTVSVGDFVKGFDGNQWRTARLLGSQQHQFRLQFQDYNDRPVRLVDATEVAPLAKVELKPHPPVPLDEAASRERARVHGKYTGLLRKFEADGDFLHYGPFRDWGRWTGSVYQGNVDLPTGYWVYVYPNWYIWERSREDMRPFGPLQATGTPDVEQSGRASNAWAPSFENRPRHWLQLDFEAAVQPATIVIHECEHPGAVFQVTGVHKEGESLLWKGTDPVSRQQDHGVARLAVDAERTFQSLRVYVDGLRVQGDHHIDAVMVIDRQGYQHWPTGASAISAIGQGDLLDYQDPFQTRTSTLR